MTSSCVVTPKQSSINSYDHKSNDPPPPPQPNTLQHPHQASYPYPYYTYNQPPPQQTAYLAHPPLRDHPLGSMYSYYSTPVPSYGRRPSSPPLGLTPSINSAERGGDPTAAATLPEPHHLHHHSQHTLPPLADSTRQRSPPSPTSIHDTNATITPTIVAHHHRRRPPPLRATNTTTTRAVKEKRTFACQVEDCGKIFKRSEHLKRHNRSIHTNEKPFECPYQQCLKRFSRSDNLNQHIRIHRQSSKESSTP